MAYGQSINSLINVYARAISPTGTPTLEDKREARIWLSEVTSPAQAESVLQVLEQEMKAARSAPQAVREELRAAILGHGSGATPQPAVPNEGQKGVSKSGKPIIFRNGQWEYAQ